MNDKSKERKFSKSVAGALSDEFDERCSLCRNVIPDGQLVVRNNYTHQMICVLCIVGIAEIPI